MPGIISTIEKDSIAEELGWEPGDEIVSINGHALHDVIDFRFYSSDEFLMVLVRRGDQEAEFEIEKDLDEPLGVEFKDALFDGVRTCGASCIFCFVDQLPRGLRRSLYLKDDDFRLSFLHGNFITLANLSDEDLDRIVTQRLSPLYVSIHATDHALRQKIIGRKIPDVLAQIDRLSQGRITIHAQIVLCRGINDGDHLDRTISDLGSRHPTVASIAVVPAAVTSHRRHTTPIGLIDPAYSAEVLGKVKNWQSQFLRNKGTRLVWAADEFYLNAGGRIPKAAFYEGYPQIENGVGLVRVFKDSAYRARRILPDRLPRPVDISIATGPLAAPLLREWANSTQTAGLNIRIHEVRNRLFGETVTVAGLMSGRDVGDQLRNRILGDVVFVPSVALRDDSFLDDVTLGDLSQVLGCRVEAVEPMPYALAKRIVAMTSEMV
jgi:putative radical SAM enzyme (TIGR03279 family)